MSKETKAHQYPSNIRICESCDKTTMVWDDPSTFCDKCVREAYDGNY